LLLGLPVSSVLWVSQGDVARLPHRTPGGGHIGGLSEVICGKAHTTACCAASWCWCCWSRALGCWAGWAVNRGTGGGVHYIHGVPAGHGHLQVYLS
jgi:hypothetical protein